MTDTHGKAPIARADEPARTRGHTYIDDGVVSMLAQHAASQVEGVHKVGSALRNLWSRTAGISSEVGLKQAALDLDVAVEVGTPIKDVTSELRERVIETVEKSTGLEVVAVDIRVTDIHVPEQKPRATRRVE